MRQSTKHKIVEGVKKTYNEIAQEFSQTRNHPWPEFKFIEKHIPKNKEISILDVGCGNGRLINYIDKKHSYYGIDISSKLVECAKKIHPNHNFKVADMLDANDMPTEQFDFVLCIASFHHIPSSKSRLQALENLHKVLKPGGKLIIIVWNLWQPKYRKYLSRALLKSIITLGNYHPRDTFIPWGKKKVPRYYHCFTPKEMEKLFHRSGFKLLEKYITKGAEEVGLLEGHNQIYVCTK